VWLLRGCVLRRLGGCDGWHDGLVMLLDGCLWLLRGCVWCRHGGCDGRLVLARLGVGTVADVGAVAGTRVTISAFSSVAESVESEAQTSLSLMQ
jgi:hypothetical protein